MDFRGSIPEPLQGGIPLPLKIRPLHREWTQMHPMQSHQFSKNTPDASGRVGVDSTSNRMKTTQTGPQSTFKAMFTANRRIVQAKEESAKALRRSAAAKQKIADTLRDMLLDDVSQATPPPLHPKLPTPPKKQSPKK